MHLRRRLLAIPASALVPMLLSGCQINQHRNGKNQNVDIGTPFGSIHVKSDEPAAVAQTGLTPYPGAVPVHKHGDSDDGAADISMNFGNFKLGVHAAEFTTADPQDKVLAFYRRDLGRYGAVITCDGRKVIGQPTRTADGLTCEERGKVQNVDLSEIQLRAGSEVHQHIVGVQERDGGTHIGLVALDLPSAVLKDHDSGSEE